ncbi:MAG: hypothetical protein HWD61_06580 [Parachlamydiaceae bacterium]|nr:MAG: hypothetical protein HWD61_06580 [Parachlamydiaceae bacterium]
MLTLIFVPIAAAIFTLGTNTLPPSSNLFVPEVCTVDEWQKLINDGIEIASTIKNPVERNKLLQFLQNLKEINQESPDISESNSFYEERQRIKWEEISSKLKSRLASAQQNLPDSNDKALIVRVLQDLHLQATKAIPSNTTSQESIASSINEFWNPSEYVRNVYIDEWIEYNLAEVKKQLGNFSPSVFISYAWGPTENFLSNVWQIIFLWQESMYA